MTTLRELRSRGSTRMTYETMEFYHSSFGYVRLVNSQMFEKTLGGMVFQPSVFKVDESQQSKTPVIDASISFGRIGPEFKEKLKLWRGSSRVTPISSVYRVYDSSNGQELKKWALYVSNVSIDKDNVTASITLINPVNNNVSLLYNPSEWTGLING
jgi:hypothetical protein